MQHSWHADVLRIRERGSEFVRQIEPPNGRADDLVLPRVFRFHIGRDVQIPLLSARRDLRVERLAANQRRIRHAFRGIAGDADDAVCHRELIHRRSELQGRTRQ